MESLDGTIVHVMFHKPSKWNPGGEPFLIAKFKCSEGKISIKGSMRKPAVGEEYRLFGEMRPQKGGYDDAFEFTSYEPLCDRSTSGVAHYLSQHVDGIGPIKAAAIVAVFGVDTLDVLRLTSHRVLEVPGVNQKCADAIKLHFEETTRYDPVALARTTDLLKEYRVSDNNIKKMVAQWGSGTADFITEHPYIIMDFPRIGWKTADAFALGKVNHDPAALDRHKAAVLESLERLAFEGHTCATESEITNMASGLLGMQLDDFAVESLYKEDEVIEKSSDDYGEVYQLASLAYAEETIADCLDHLIESGNPFSVDWYTPEWAKEAGLSEEQAQAAESMSQNPVVILTGAPGVGKSYVVSQVVSRLISLDFTSIRVAAPTGKAAKRFRELLDKAIPGHGIESTTIHKLLAPVMVGTEEGVSEEDARFGRGRDPFGFSKNQGNPLEYQLIIIDEVSMLDSKLGASLFRAIAPGTRVIFIGDHNQLPSVGPGSTLRDMMAAGIPTVVLNEIRRSDGGGTVVQACHAIKDGIVPSPANRIEFPTHNWVHIEVNNPNEIAAKIVELNSTTKTFDKLWDVQVISPQKARLAIGCDNLNRLLSNELNPNSSAVGLLTTGQNGETIADYGEEPPFRPGDKVVRTKNGMADEMFPIVLSVVDDDDPFSVESLRLPERSDIRWRDQDYKVKKVDVVNGDMGYVEDVLTDGPLVGVIVKFRYPDRLCWLPLPQTKNHIILAYAMTVHKMQGSGSPYCIVPLHNSFYFDPKTNKGLWCRELIYTAISRTEQLLITVGNLSALGTAVSRKTVHRRRTTLARRIRDGGRETRTNQDAFLYPS